MAARSFNPMLSRRAPSVATKLAATARAPAAKPAASPRAAAGVPRFAAPRHAAADTDTSLGRVSPARPLSSAPTGTRRALTSKPPATGRARVARPESPWERQAGRLAARALSTEKSASKPTLVAADAPASAAKPTPAHPGLGPSPPLAEGSNSHPLPAALRRRLEAMTGFDLSAVRVLTGPAVERLAVSLRARAFTQHGRIHLGPAASLADATLLAHETAHVLQQTLAAPQLALLELSPADPETILRQPLGGLPFADRRRARHALTGSSALPRWLLPDGVVRAIHWAGDDGLRSKLTMAVPEALKPSLDPLRALENIWRFAEQQADSYPDRERIWNGLRHLAAQTDDPSLIAAARGIASQLPTFLGFRWAHLERMLKLTIKVAELSARRWEGGLTSLAPRVAAVLDDLSAEIGEAFDLFPEGSWTRNALRTALGCPSSIRTASDIVAWVDGMRRTADEWIQALFRQAHHLVTAQYDSSSLAQLAASGSPARAVASDLQAIATIMSPAEGLIRERKKLAPLLPRVRQQMTAIDRALPAPAQSMTYAFDNYGFVLQLWGRAPVLEAFFPGEFTWLDRIGQKFDPWIGQQEPPLFAVAQESFAGLDRWSRLVTQTITEADQLDQEVPTYDSGWTRVIKTLYAALTGAKEKIVEKLKQSVPFLRELIAAAPRLWQRAQSLFQRFVERIFKEGRILAPLWEFFLGVIGLELPDNFVRDIAQRAGSLLGKILKHPFRFLGTLAAGIFTGLKNFAGNIGNHLLNALLDWLLGEFDLKPPPTLGKILDALRDQIGLTRMTVCEAIAAFLKSKHRTMSATDVERRLDQAIKVGATALRWLVHLFRGQFAEFWQEIKQHLATLWKWLVDRAVEWVMDKFKAELPKLLVDTLASGFFSAIKAIYDAIQTIRRYVDQVFAIVRSVFLAVEQIANGNVAPAAQAVETAAANGLSVALGFLARFARLQAIVDYLKQGFREIKELVRRAIAALVKLTGDVWLWLYDLAQAGREWWKDKRAFRDQEGEPRQLLYDISGAGVVFRVSPSSNARGQVGAQATPPTLAEHLAAIRPANQKEEEAHGELQNLAGQIDKIKKDAGGSFSASQGELIQVLFNECVLLLGTFSGHRAPPPTQVAWTPRTIYGDTYGARMVAEPLSVDPGGLVGSKPVSTDTTLWDRVRVHKNGGDTHYIKGHLLNHHLHGPGTWHNMIPIARSTNSRMETIAESDVKRAVIGQNKVVRYEVHMVFGAHSPKAKTNAEDELPSRIEMSCEELVYRRGKWAPSGNKIIDVSPLKNELRR